MIRVTKDTAGSGLNLSCDVLQTANSSTMRALHGIFPANTHPVGVGSRHLPSQRLRLESFTS